MEATEGGWVMDIRNEVMGAEARIRPYARQTILEYSPALSQQSGAQVYCKLENLQYTGSFKLRGAMNKLLSLADSVRSKGVVAASTGNHGAAVAYSMQKLDAPGIIFVPENADSSKVAIVKQSGAEVRSYGFDCAETEVHARQYAAEKGMTYISPYNDLQVIGGQGTIGIELEQQLRPIDAVFVSLGGGGLISGIAGYLKHVIPSVEIVGCSPENSQVMIQSLEAGRIVDIPSLPTLSDGTAGGLEDGAVTFELCQKLVDTCLTVTEEEIRASLLLFMRAHHMMIEGAAAVAIASFLKVQEHFKNKTVALLICGANISLETLKQVLHGPTD
ncbi:threonine/serine dehydratase [Candidatus Neomarinimicrobiota bacterium]